MSIIKIEPWGEGEFVISVNGKICGQTLSKSDARKVESWLHTAITELTESITEK